MSVTLFTPFGPDRPWAIDLWADSVPLCGLPAGAHLLVVDNTCDDLTSSYLDGAVQDTAASMGFTHELIRAPFGRRRGGAGNLHKRMRGLWALALPRLQGDYCMSLESDVVPPLAVVPSLMRDLRGGCAASAALMRARRGGRVIVGPAVAECRPERVTCVHQGCTLYRTDVLRQAARIAAELGPWDSAIGYAIMELGYWVRHRADLVTRHYIEEGRYV